MYLGQGSLDVPLTTVSQDPLSTVPSVAYPGLAMNAPDVLVGAAPAPASTPLGWLILVPIAFFFLQKKG